MWRISTSMAKAVIYNLGSASKTPVQSASSHFMNLILFFPLILLHVLPLPPKTNILLSTEWKPEQTSLQLHFWGEERDMDGQHKPFYIFTYL